MLLFKTKTVGNLGERDAVKFLKKNRYKILEKNYTTKFGEIDIIAEKDGCICFVEVKTRSSEKFGEPRDAVNYNKQKKIISVANYYMLGKEECSIRFDVIEVRFSKEYNKVMEIEHIENAFWC